MRTPIFAEYKDVDTAFIDLLETVKLLKNKGLKSELLIKLARLETTISTQYKRLDR